MKEAFVGVERRKSATGLPTKPGCFV